MDRKIQPTRISTQARSSTRPGLKASHGQVFARTTILTSMLCLTIILAACSPSKSTASPTSAAPATIAPQNTTSPATMVPQDTATPAPADTAAPAATSAPQQAVVTTQLDPCALITTQQASAFTGASYNQGKEGMTAGGMKTCVYGGNTTNILTIEVVQAPDVATAQADKAQFLAELQSKMQELSSEGLNVTQVPSFADGAVTANVNLSSGGTSISGNAFGFLKGTVFFGFSDIAVGGSAPTDAAMKAEATTVLGELP